MQLNADVRLVEKGESHVPSKMTIILDKIGLGRMSSGEYQANLAGMNTFFGAVLGFVLTGMENIENWRFGIILMMLAAIVISILFISSSRRRIFYSVYTLVFAATFPELVDLMFDGHNLVPEKVRPTLLAWTLMTILVEFWGREKPERPQA